MTIIMHVRNERGLVGGKKELEKSDSGYHIEDRASMTYLQNECEI